MFSPSQHHWQVIWFQPDERYQVSWYTCALMHFVVLILTLWCTEAFTFITWHAFREEKCEDLCKHGSVGRAVSSWLRTFHSLHVISFFFHLLAHIPFHRKRDELIVCVFPFIFLYTMCIYFSLGAIFLYKQQPNIWCPPKKASYFQLFSCFGFSDTKDAVSCQEDSM